jgi:hypothetical protein
MTVTDMRTERAQGSTSLREQVERLRTVLFERPYTVTEGQVQELAALIEQARQQYDARTLQVVASSFAGFYERIPIAHHNARWAGALAGLALSARAAADGCPPQLTRQQWQVLAWLTHSQGATGADFHENFKDVRDARESLEALVDIGLVQYDEESPRFYAGAGAKAALVRYAAEAEARRIELGVPPKF